MILYFSVFSLMVVFACTKGEEEITLDTETQALVSILEDAQSLTENKFPSYTSEAFAEYMQQIDAIQDSLTSHKNILILKSSEKEFQLHARILRVIRQVSEVMYVNKTNDYTTNYRDKYMAENTSWVLDYFDWLIYFDQSTASKPLQAP